MDDYKSSVMYFLSDDADCPDDALRIKQLEQSLRFVIKAIELHQEGKEGSPLLKFALDEAKKALQ